MNFLALLLMVGAVAFRFGVLERARVAIGDDVVLNTDSAVRRIGVLAALLGVIACGLRLWLQSGMLNGPERMWQSDMLSAMIFHTGWGKAWLAEVVACVGFLLSALITTKDRLESWYSAGAFAVIAASTPAFSGHAAAVQQMAIVPVLDDAVHVISASSWLGSLAILLFAGLPIALRSENGFAKAATLVNTFSPLALLMAGIAVFTGAMNAFVHITAFSDFWTTSYGKVLAIKIGVVLITASTGAYNWKVVRPRLGTVGATSHIKKSATAELIVAAVVILITAVLVGTPNP
jgi:putative copper export protein